MVDSNVASGRNDLNSIKEPEKEVEKEKSSEDSEPVETETVNNPEDQDKSQDIVPVNNPDQLGQSQQASSAIPCPLIPENEATNISNDEGNPVFVEDATASLSEHKDNGEIKVIGDEFAPAEEKSGPDKDDFVLSESDLAKVAEALVNSKFINKEYSIAGTNDSNLSEFDSGDTLINENTTDCFNSVLDNSLNESEDLLEFKLYSKGRREANPSDSVMELNESLTVSSMESLEERPHSSLFSPVTSTPRSRLSSTPCSGPHGHRTLPPSRSVQANTSGAEGPLSLPSLNNGSKSYDYLLKVLLVGDSDVGKQEIITGMEDGSLDSPYCSSAGAAYKTTIILIDGKKVKLHIWDTSGQGRFCTIIRSYSRGAQGILLVYDITNRWSFEGINRWVREVEEHAPGIPKVLVGNRLHLAFKRQVDPAEAELYAEKHNMGFYEISPLVNFNITESFQELCRMALKRNGMERLWRSNRVLSLHELCCHAIVGRTNVYGIDKLPLPDAVKANLKSYAMTSYPVNRQHYKTLKERKKRSRPPDASATNCVNVSRKSCVIA